MSSYQNLIHSLERDLKEMSPDEKQKNQIKEEIKIYELLDNMSEAGKFTLCDSGIFNQIILGYVKLALEEYEKVNETKLKEEFKERLMTIAYQNLDSYGSESAKEYYFGK